MKNGYAHALLIISLVIASITGNAQAVPEFTARFDTSSVRGSAGYFRVAKTHEGQWWFLTPENEPFFYKGVCAVNRDGTQGGRRARPGAYAATVDRKYAYQQGPDSFVTASISRLRNLGFNALGAWTTEEFFNKQMPFTEILEFFKEPPFLPGQQENRLPDIFDPLWEVAIDKKARALCTPLRYSKDLVGYFTDNEIGFGKADDSGFDPGFVAGQLNMALLQTVLGMDTGTAAFNHALQFIKSRHGGSYRQLSLAWGATIDSPKDLHTFHDTASATRTKAYLADAAAFVKHYTERYFELAAKAIRRHDPNHLLLGCRFGNLPPSYVIEAIRPWTDVVSANNYRPTLYERYDTLHNSTGLPLLIGEISWNTGLFKKIPVAGEKDNLMTERERMFQTGSKTLRRAAMHNGIIGFTWYRWVQGTSTPEKFYDGIVDYNDALDMHAPVLKGLLGGLDSLRRVSAVNGWKRSNIYQGELILFPENIKLGWDQYLRASVYNGKWERDLFGWQAKGKLLKVEEKSGRMKIHIQVEFGDPAEKSSGLYDIDMQRNGEKFYGNYTGSYKGKPVAGKITAFYFPE